MDAGTLLSELARADRGDVPENPRLRKYMREHLSAQTRRVLAAGGAAVTMDVDADGRRIRLCWFGAPAAVTLSYCVLGGQVALDQSA